MSDLPLTDLSASVEKDNLAMLSDLLLLTEYRTRKEDPATLFYLPCLSSSTTYWRAAGFFRSTVFSLIGRAIVSFAKRGGKMKLLCSPRLSEEDVDSIALGYRTRMEVLTERTLEDVDALLADEATQYHSRVLATLIALGHLEIKFADPVDGSGMYHEKLGIFGDAFGNHVSFKGSANETWSAWATHGNFESIEVFCSWRGGIEEERVERHLSHFSRLWSGTDPDLYVFDFPAEAGNRLKRVAMGNMDEIDGAWLEEGTQRSRSALPHQAAAIQTWKLAGERGILEHATGSGKTFTAILAIRQHVAKRGPSLILVPSKLLLEQWRKEIEDEIPSATLLLAGAGHARWRFGERVAAMTTADSQSLGPRIVIATMQTAATDQFLSRVAQGDHLLVVADEVHQIGSPFNSRSMAIKSGSRLGLSATPKRFGDPEGTARIFEYFGDVILPKVTLRDAIRSGRLVGYEYYPHPVNLSLDEADEWRKLTRQIRNELSRSGQEDGNSPSSWSQRAKMLLIRRSRIAKKASAKVSVAIELVRNHYREGERWLVYCEDQEQVKEVVDGLKFIGVNPLEYHTSMEGDSEAALEWFRTFGGPLVAIRCLDEGIDIPEITHALILASSQNPRQFIQRRGRVLRTAPGKHRAVIHDLIVVPVSLDDEPAQLSLLKSELTRSLEFARDALNSAAGAQLRLIAVGLGIDPESVSEDGFEVDSENE